MDASYLSPNVNMASRLEAATKQYGVPLLLSRNFVDCVSPPVRARVSKRGDARLWRLAVNPQQRLWLRRAAWLSAGKLSE